MLIITPIHRIALILRRKVMRAISKYVLSILYVNTVGAIHNKLGIDDMSQVIAMTANEQIRISITVKIDRSKRDR